MEAEAKLYSLPRRVCYVTGHIDATHNVYFMYVSFVLFSLDNAIWVSEEIMFLCSLAYHTLSVALKHAFDTWISVWNEVSEFLDVTAHWPSRGKWAAKDQLSTAPQMCVCMWVCVATHDRWS